MVLHTNQSLGTIRLQRGYVVFGMNWYSDPDNWTIEVYIWPFVFVYSRDYIRIP